MAIKILSKGSGKGKNCIMEFQCDTEADVANLPTEHSTGALDTLCSVGSRALIADTKAIVVLNTQEEWV